MENAHAIQVVAKKEVLIEALTPYAFEDALIAPVTTEDWTVARTEAAMMVVVEIPDTKKVRQDPAREQMAKTPKKSSTAQVRNAMMYTICVHLDMAMKVLKEPFRSVGRVTVTPDVEVARASIAVVFKDDFAQLYFADVQLVFPLVTEQ